MAYVLLFSHGNCESNVVRTYQIIINSFVNHSISEIVTFVTDEEALYCTAYSLLYLIVPAFITFTVKNYNLLTT